MKQHPFALFTIKIKIERCQLGLPLTPNVSGFLLLIKIWTFFGQKLMKIARVALQKLAQKGKFDQICYLTRFGKAKPS